MRLLRSSRALLRPARASELSGLVFGSDDARGFNDAEEHVVERIDVADQGQRLAIHPGAESAS